MVAESRCFMLRVIYDCITKETTYEEIPDIIEPIFETIQEPTIEQKIEVLTEKVSQLEEKIS